MRELERSMMNPETPLMSTMALIPCKVSSQTLERKRVRGRWENRIENTKWFSLLNMLEIHDTYIEAISSDWVTNYNWFYQQNNKL